MLQRNIWCGSSRLASRQSRFSIPGRVYCRPPSFNGGVSSRRRASSRRCASAFPAQRSLAFRGVPGPSLSNYLAAVPVDAVGLDWMIELGVAREHDPKRCGRFRAISIRWHSWPAEKRSIDAVDVILEAFTQGPFIFNLGHGVLPRNADRTCGATDRARARRGSRVCGALRTGVAAMTSVYLWLKAFHIIAVIAWMAGMLYLPRLFVYHCAAEKGSVQSETFKVMERRLLRAIINPAMIAAWVLGLTLAWLGPDSATAGSPPAGCRPNWCWCWRYRRCTVYLPAGSRISPPTRTGIRRNSIDLQRDTNDPDDCHRHSGGAETVLRAACCQCKVCFGSCLNCGLFLSLAHPTERRRMQLSVAPVDWSR